MSASRRRRLVPFVAVTLCLLGATAVSVGARAATTAALQTWHAYHPGTATTPSTEIAGYTGPRLSLQVKKVGAPGMEPTIGVAGDGTAYYGAAHLVLDTPYTWGGARTDTRMSTDGGKTWRSIQLGTGIAGMPPANADPMIYVDPTTGRVFNFDLEGACNFLNYSDDKGQTWTTNPVACGNLVVDHQTIVAGRPPAGITTSGYPNVVYWCSNRVADSTCGRSLDGGITWAPTGQSAYLGYDPAAGGLCGGLTGHLATDPAGRIFLPKGHCGHPWVAISDDGGATWSRVQVSRISASDTHLSVASDNAGNLYYGWWGGTHDLPFLAVSRDHGKTWSKPMMIAPPGVHAANLVTVAAGAAGRVAITFLSSTDPRDDAHRPMDQTVVVSTNALSANPTFVSTMANPAGDPVHRGNDCTQGRCGGIWDFIDIHISKAGQLWASMSDDCVDTCVTKGERTALHAGVGYAIREVGGPGLGTPFQYSAP
jgi:BNR/Asp-box repeat